MIDKETLHKRLESEPVLTKKTYLITVEQKASGQVVRRTNDGFNCYELMGILAQAQFEVMEQVRGHIDSPMITIRTVIVTPQEAKEIEDQEKDSTDTPQTEPS